MPIIDAAVVATVAESLRALYTTVASEATNHAAKVVWQKVREIFGWGERLPSNLESAIAAAPPAATAAAIRELQAHDQVWGTLVNHIDAEKVVVAQSINTLNM
jgi:hypothetical protein